MPAYVLRGHLEALKLSCADGRRVCACIAPVARQNYAGGIPKFRFYRRRKTNKAPRKRLFVMFMTKTPDLLMDSIGSQRAAGASWRERVAQMMFWHHASALAWVRPLAAHCPSDWLR